MTLFSAIVLLLLVMDPFGSIPLFVAALHAVPEDRRAKIILRECAIAFIVLLAFMLVGNEFLRFLHISQTSLGISGGIILFLIALRMIFPTSHGIFGDLPEGEPLIVPLAIPLIAGPSATATVLLLASRWPNQLGQWVLALIIAQAITTIVLSLGSRFAQVLGRRGLVAIERLTGLILTALAVEMFLEGVKEFVMTCTA